MTSTTPRPTATTSSTTSATTSPRGVRFRGAGATIGGIGPTPWAEACGQADGARGAGGRSVGGAGYGVTAGPHTVSARCIEGAPTAWPDAVGAPDMPGTGTKVGALPDAAGGRAAPQPVQKRIPGTPSRPHVPQVVILLPRSARVRRPSRR